ncbi:MAG: hypothetical protein HYV63_22575 [Candidatus Schekmanbacteria bacterium]|nr:hypothetical protein [Candidatus Schekmanbacteria bacterium]
MSRNPCRLSLTSRRLSIAAAALTGIGCLLLQVSVARAIGSSSPAEVVVTFDTSHGPADRLAALLGSTSYGTDLDIADPDNPGVHAWREAGLAYYRAVNLFDGANGVQVSREPRRGFRYDRYSRLFLRYQGLDRHLGYVRDVLGAVPIINVGEIPGVLSSCPDYPGGSTACAPTDWKEYSRLLTSVARHVDARFPGLGERTWYEVGNEPESHDGAPGEYWMGYEWERLALAGSLRSSVDWFTAAYRGLKAANPHARVAGPVTSHWAMGPDGCGAADWGPSEWLTQLAADGTGVVPDAIVYHDYAWAALDNGRLWCFGDGDDVSRASWLHGEAWTRTKLAANGFSPNIPILLTEHNRDLSDTDHVQHKAAAHLAANIARVANPINGSNLAQADFYVFDGEPGHLMAMYAAEPECRRPAWAAYAMLGAMVGQDILDTASSGAAIDVLATGDPHAPLARVLLANDNPVAAPVSLAIRNLVDWSQATAHLQAIDATSDACVPDAGSFQTVGVDEEGTLALTIEMPSFSVRLVTVTRHP